MAKGVTCPWCGHQKFRRGRVNNKDRAYSRCSNCDAVGWINAPAGTGGGSGKKCANCEKQTLHVIFDGKHRSVAHCTNKNCLAVLVFRGRDPKKKRP
jgi:hypothetical protein